LPFNFIFGPTYDDETKLGLSKAKKEGAKTIAMIGSNLAWSKLSRQYAIDEKFFQKNGLKLLINIDYKPKPTDLTSELLRLKKLNPDFVWVAATPSGIIPFIKSAKAVGFDLSKCMTDSWSVHKVVTKVYGKQADGLRGLLIIDQPVAYKGTPVGKEMDEFLSKHHRRSVDNMYVLGWLSAKCNATGIRLALNKNNNKVPEDVMAFRKMIRDAIEGINGFDIGAGDNFPRISFSDHKGFVAAKEMKVINGKWSNVSGGYINLKRM